MPRVRERKAAREACSEWMLRTCCSRAGALDRQGGSQSPMKPDATNHRGPKSGFAAGMKEKFRAWGPVPEWGLENAFLPQAGIDVRSLKSSPLGSCREKILGVVCGASCNPHDRQSLAEAPGSRWSALCPWSKRSNWLRRRTRNTTPKLGHLLHFWRFVNIWHLKAIGSKSTYSKLIQNMLKTSSLPFICSSVPSWPFHSSSQTLSYWFSLLSWGKRSICSSPKVLFWISALFPSPWAGPSTSFLSHCKDLLTDLISFGKEWYLETLVWLLVTWAFLRSWIHQWKSNTWGGSSSFSFYICASLIHTK